MAMINIDGVDLPAPSKFKPPNFDLDSGDTGRNELGILQRDRVREGVFKLELEWKGILSSQLATIKAAVKSDRFETTFPTEIGFITKTMYVSDRNIEMVKYNEDYNQIRWDISCSFTEF
nr:hypothetical protein [Sedimentibacter sp.]